MPWCKSGTRASGPGTLGPWDFGTLGPGTWNLPQSLKVGPGTPESLKEGILFQSLKVGPSRLQHSSATLYSNSQLLAQILPNLHFK